MDQVPFRLLIGIDEAGYGPNLGPLVIACSAWLVRMQAELSAAEHLESLLDTLQPAFQAKPWRPTSRFIPLGDSKAIHAGKEKNRGLQVGVGFWLDRSTIAGCEFETIVQAFDADFFADRDRLAPWYGPFDEERIEVDAIEAADAVRKQAEATIERAGLQLVGLSAKLIDEGAFNRGCEAHGNKAGLLSFESIKLAKRCLEAITTQEHPAIRDADIRSIHLYFDKHGGRHRYQAPLMQVMPESWFKVVEEGTARSAYTATWADIPMNVAFVAKGDRLLGSALASMTAKWLRELSMERFNRFWRSYFPDIEPTAGYPVDALRFRTLIEKKAVEFGLDENSWWRSR